ncbi:glycine zipper family protein [Enterobacteriales bacterium SAP-6]|uniref:Glycine zipper family protein n=2 Tax=Acerihabitans arboris TaxID=2691583 RepID=A0A845SSE2_9GAMM|nr:glycine zipper family protein [Acerihabitans arboris]
MGKSYAIIIPLLAGIVLMGCVSTPVAPTVMTLPGSGKTYDQFRVDDVICKNTAYSSLSGEASSINNRSVATVAAGTAIGTAAGAMIGSAGGPRGTADGAVIGAGGGLLAGAAVAGGKGGDAQDSLQDQYNVVYLQCMYAKGNKIPQSYAWDSNEDPSSVPPDYHP